MKGVSIMGNSFVQVYLDTTAPILTLHYPVTITENATETITIISNEPLSPNHEIVIIDHLKVEHHYTFSLLNDKKTLTGVISFDGYPKGIATLYVRAKDEVLNQTSTYKGIINISDPLFGKKLLIKNSEKTSNLILLEATQKLILSENE
jgi:hypothetical protein